MKVWTIQPWSVWLQLKKNGVYYANENLSQLLHPRDHLLKPIRSEEHTSNSSHGAKSRMPSSA